ncbi:target of Myb protein 1-like [Canna indica]|uniref:Target of Myb protein 1-like n=1 Tax=Canna indica TaxID=4628 RepID=A0AAQ3KFM5_9LILI|nr:target of Myb protein 1-like [Canna indica]
MPKSIRSWKTHARQPPSIQSHKWQAKDVVKAVKKRLQHKNPKVQFLALTLLETMIKNCGDCVHFQVVEREILQEMVKIVRKKRSGVQFPERPPNSTLIFTPPVPNLKQAMGCPAVKDEVIIDLVNQCRSNQNKLMQSINSIRDEELLGRGLELNDNLQSLLAKHDAIASGSPLLAEVSEAIPTTSSLFQPLVAEVSESTSPKTPVAPQPAAPTCTFG